MTRRPAARRSEIETHCGCFGYFGFGGGWALAERRRARLAPKPEQPTYCSSGCSRADACWDRHRDRVRSLLPALCDEFDRALDAGDTGPEVVRDFITKYGSEPYLAVMLGNMEDGGRCAKGLAPNDLAEASLTWPLERLD